MILLVEDNLDLRRAYEVLFRLKGFAMASVADGASALTQLNENVAPALVILDINLPDKDGMTLLVHIRDTPALMNVPVIMHSAQSHRRDEAMSLGADAFITKGVDDVELLLETVRELIDVA